ncbi:MAG: pitrilysin family protein [Candidatus Zixiibacteriota bacterium]
MMKSTMEKRLIGVALVLALAAGLATCGPGADSNPTVLIPKDGAGSIRVRLMFGAGSAYDPDGKEGLAHFTAAALKRGSARFSRSEIDSKLDAMAARLTVEVEREVSIIEGLCLTESWPEFSDLFFSVITEPRFDPTEMTALVSDQLDEIEQIKRDDADLAKAALQYYIYKDHPYGHPTAGLEHTVKTFTAQDARAFFRDHYTSGNYTLGLAGDVSDTLARSIHRVLKSALTDGAPARPVLPDPIITSTQVYLIEKENRAQAQLRFGRPIDITRRDPDFVPLFLVNSYLGRHRESMGQLYRQIRAARGLSYGAYSYAEHFEQEGWSNLARPGLPRRQQYFSVWVYPKSINANFVIRIVMKMLADLREQGLTAQQLDAARRFEINHFPFEIETPRRLLGMRMDEVAYGTPAFVDSFTARAAAVTVEDAKRAIQRAIDPSSMVIVAVVSDAEQFATSLLGDQVMFQYPSGVDPRGLRQADRPFLNYTLPIQAGNIRIVKAEEMFR